MSWDDWFERRRRFPFWDLGPFTMPLFSKDADETLREMERHMEEMILEFAGRIPGELIRERKLKDGSTVREMGPFVYGYSITVGPDGKPQLREFGNVKPRLKAGKYGPSLDLKDAREPLVDIMTTNGEVKVIAELPGVEKNDIKVHVTDTTLTISVDKAGRKYHKELDLPGEVEPTTAKSTYINGVLEVTLHKTKEKKPKGAEIKID